jgi:hypothetical protein
MKATLRMMNKDEFAPAHVAEHIAVAIVEQLQKKGQCSIIDIKALGFSLNDIARYWPEACRIAERARPRVFP